MLIDITKKDILWSYLSNIFCMGANFFLLPFVIACLDEDELGLWYVFLSLGTLSNLFDFGFAVTLARNITYCWSGAQSLNKEGCNGNNLGEPNFLLMKKVLAASKFIYAVITVAMLVMLLAFGTMYLFYVVKSIEYSQWIAAWIIFVFSLTINMYYGYYNSFLYGVGAIEFANKIRVYARLVQMLVTLILLILNCGILGICFANLVYGVIFRYLGKKTFYKYKDIGKCILKVEYDVSKNDVKETFYIVWHNAWRDGVIAISNFCTDQFSTMLCAMYVSLSETGMYAIVLQIVSAIAIFSSIVYNAYQPKLQSAWANNDSKSIREAMSVIVSSYTLLFLLGVCIFVAVIYPLLVYFKPQGTLNIAVCILVLLYQFLFGLRNCYTSYFSCSNRIIYLNAFILSSILFVITSYVIENYFKVGILGVVLAQLFSQGVYNFWYWIKKGNEEMQINIYQLLYSGFDKIMLR